MGIGSADVAVDEDAGVVRQVLFGESDEESRRRSDEEARLVAEAEAEKLRKESEGLRNQFEQLQSNPKQNAVFFLLTFNILFFKTGPKLRILSCDMFLVFCLSLMA